VELLLYKKVIKKYIYSLFNNNKSITKLINYEDFTVNKKYKYVSGIIKVNIKTGYIL